VANQGNTLFLDSSEKESTADYADTADTADEENRWQPTRLPLQQKARFNPPIRVIRVILATGRVRPIGGRG
jgi:hypothetical protein